MTMPTPGGFVQQQSYGGPPGPQQSGKVSAQDTTGHFDGGRYMISHRDDNTVLTLYLQGLQGGYVKSRSNSMIMMSSTIQMSGQFKVSFKNLLSTGQISQATYQGEGEVMLSPQVWGDIIPIHMDGSHPWFLGHHAYLASTADITWTAKSQGFRKTLFSGDGMFVANVTGRGVLFVEAIGALVEKNLAAGEEVIIDRGHLVAWNCQYKMEKLGTGGFMSRLASGEWYVCRFTGPGTIYLQTRNPEHIIEWISEQLPSRN